MPKTTVAPMTRTCGHFARSRATPSFIAAMTWSVEALPFLLKSLMPSSQIRLEMPDSESTSRSSRWPEAGPPANGLSGPYSAGPAIWLPPMPPFTTATLLP